MKIVQIGLGIIVFQRGRCSTYYRHEQLNHYPLWRKGKKRKLKLSKSVTYLCILGRVKHKTKQLDDNHILNLLKQSSLFVWAT